MNSAEYAEGLRLRLPKGEPWPEEETDGTTGWDLILKALAQEPARIDDDVELLLEQAMPDNVNTDLAGWEAILGTPATALGTTERLARIRGLLQPRGQVNLTALQTAIRALAGDNNVILHNRAFPTVGAGTLAAGCGCGYQPYSWVCALYPNALSVAPDAFNLWTLWSSTVTANAHNSPITLAQTAAGTTPHVSHFPITPINGTVDNDVVRLSFWVRAQTAAEIRVRYFLRSNAYSAWGPSTPLAPEMWYRIVHTGSVGVGAATPYASIGLASGNDDPTTVRFSWAHAGITKPALEAEIRAMFPIHTRGYFSTIGELELLLAQSPSQAGV